MNHDAPLAERPLSDTGPCDRAPPASPPAGARPVRGRLTGGAGAMAGPGAGGERGGGRFGWLRRAMGVEAPSPPAVVRPAADGGRRLLCIGPDPQAIADLAARLEQELPDLEVLPAPGADPHPAPGADTPPPSAGGRRPAARWLAPLAPDVALWHGPAGPDPLLEALISSGVPVIAVDVPAPVPEAPRRRRAWRAILGGLARILARDEAAARAIRQIGPAGLRIEVAGPFVPVPEPPPCEESDRDYYAHLLRARPTWLAAFPTEAEIPALVEAHRIALQGAHRSLLLLCPRDETKGPTIAAWLRSEGWRVARHGAGEEPDDSTEIFVTDSHEEIGLWYRLAPVCVIGGTFRPDAAGAADPSGAARLGSAILRGPEAAPHQAWLERLDRAGGAVRVEEIGALEAALSDTLSPDRAAALAQAAWDVASDGARVQERIVAAVRDVLRETGAPGPGAG